MNLHQQYEYKERFFCYVLLFMDYRGQVIGRFGKSMTCPPDLFADKPNFVRRNRIVAGMSDACIVVESAAKGGSLITAGISQSYDRHVFAFPGSTAMPYSEGCNHLIRDNVAGLITCAEDFVKAMGWQNEGRRQQALTDGIERNLFPDLSPEESAIVGLLQQTNDLQLSVLSVKTGIPIGQLTALLFQMEMKGIVRPLAGGMYHLLR